MNHPPDEGRFVPANPEAEQSVLGSLLIDPDAVIDVASSLKAADFYQEKNGWIYQAILDLHERRIPADFITLTDELERRKQLSEVGGTAYVMDLINAVPTAIHVQHYANIVSGKAKLRGLIRAGGQIAQLAYEDGDIDQTLEQAEKVWLEGISRNSTQTLCGIDALIPGVVDHIEILRADQRALLGVPTGFTDLDKLLGGLQKSDLDILAARPGMGKTSLAICIAHNAAVKHGKNVAFFSLEMSNEQIVQRLFAVDAGINTVAIRNGKLSNDEFDRLMASAGVISDAPLYIDDTGAISLTELRTKSRILHAQVDLDLIIVDYLQLVTTGDKFGRNREQEVAAISRGLKALAKELDVPVLALSQLSRTLENRSDKRPVMSDLRESGAIENDADVIVFLYREDQYVEHSERQGIVDVIVAKHRNGPTGTISLHFQEQYTRFTDLALVRQPLNTYSYDTQGHVAYAHPDN